MRIGDRKHNFKRGVSIVIALVIFLLCALAGASAFMMAASNAGRYSHSDEQEYYSVSSAVLLFVDMFDEFQYTSDTVKFDYKREWTYDGEWNYDSESNQHTTTDGYTLTMPGEGKMDGARTLQGGLDLCTLLRDHCDLLVPYLNVPNEWYDSAADNEGTPPKRPTSVPTLSYTFSISVEKGDTADDRFGTVECKMLMTTNYDLLFTFKSTTGEYAITVYWPPELEETKKEEKPTYSYTTKENGVFVNGSMVQNRTLSVVAKWLKANVTISRGEAITGEGA